jgi:hypothetical protein
MYKPFHGEHHDASVTACPGIIKALGFKRNTYSLFKPSRSRYLAELYRNPIYRKGLPTRWQGVAASSRLPPYPSALSWPGVQETCGNLFPLPSCKPLQNFYDTAHLSVFS